MKVFVVARCRRSQRRKYLRVIADLADEVTVPLFQIVFAAFLSAGVTFHQTALMYRSITYRALDCLIVVHHRAAAGAMADFIGYRRRDPASESVVSRAHDFSPGDLISRGREGIRAPPCRKNEG